MTATATPPEQLTMLDAIDRAIASAQLQDDLVHRRDLPLAAIGGPERLLYRLVEQGLPETALPAAAGLVLRLEQQAIDQRRDDRDRQPA